MVWGLRLFHIFGIMIMVWTSVFKKFIEFSNTTSFTSFSWEKCNTFNFSMKYHNFCRNIEFPVEATYWFKITSKINLSAWETTQFVEICWATLMLMMFIYKHVWTPPTTLFSEIGKHFFNNEDPNLSRL